MGDNVLNIFIRGFQKIHKWSNDCIIAIESKIGRVKIARIEKGNNLGEKVYVFKEKTIERVELQDIYQFSRNGSYEVEYPELDVWKFTNATVCSDSDFVAFDDGKAFWPKYYAHNYSKNIVRDKYLAKESNGLIYYRVPKVVHKVKSAFSLIGVHAHVWSHALSDYYTKLSVLDEVIDYSNDRITVLVPDYTDNQLKQIVYAELNKKDVDILIVKWNEAVKAETLFFIENPGFFTDHEIAVEVGDNIQPKIVADIIKEQLVTPAIHNLVNKTPIKLYLPRRGNYRTLTNNDEIEAFFKSQGFVFLEPHKITLEEKIQLFNSADVVVGPYSSAFSNLIFCNPGTKVLIMSNFYRAFESWLVMHKQHFGMDMLWVTGYDDKNAFNPAHCNYTISLQKVIDAAKYKGIVE